MLKLSTVRRLNLDKPAGPQRPSHLSAASGLVQINERLYVVADDELHLGVFSASGDAPGDLIRLFDGDLPATLPARKKLKPDLESLVRLPAFGGYPHGALLAVGSGSKKLRRRGVLLLLNEASQISGAPQVLDLGDLHRHLKLTFDDLNIEGAAIVDDNFVLLQRGNKGDARNACVRYSLTDFLRALSTDHGLTALRPHEITYYDLGRSAEVPLCFTDAVGLPNGEMVFTAVAEDTDNSYDDGACVGAAVGTLDQHGRLTLLEHLAVPYKLEGIHAWHSPAGIEFIAVTDADAVDAPACVLAGCLRRTA
jgi:hypothetical protein